MGEEDDRQARIDETLGHYAEMRAHGMARVSWVLADPGGWEICVDLAEGGDHWVSAWEWSEHIDGLLPPGTWVRAREVEERIPQPMTDERELAWWRGFGERVVEGLPEVGSALVMQSYRVWPFMPVEDTVHLRVIVDGQPMRQVRADRGDVVDGSMDSYLSIDGWWRREDIEDERRQAAGERWR